MTSTLEQQSIAPTQLHPPTRMYQWQMVEPEADFILVEKEIPETGEGEALVKVAGCGVCHTDLSFWCHGVKTKHPLPLTLGHEISGVVIAGDQRWLGKPVIIPAVLPCGECDLCRKGRSNICRKQLMPGNDFDGGFASHIKVPSRYLCEVPISLIDRYPLEHLAVVADAISTPYQVIRKSELEAGDLAIAIGVGGVGIYGALIAKIFGARVIAIDISDDKLEIAKTNGVDRTLNVRNMDVKAVKEQIKQMAKELGAPAYGWKIFEFSGTKAGQELAFNLLTFTSTISIVGFTMDRLEVRLSNLMAFDAKMIGTWGCRAELYPEVVDLISQNKLSLTPFVQTFPLSDINTVFQNTEAGKYTRRTVLVPDME